MLVVETISDGAKMAQNQTRELRWAMSGLKRRYILARLPLISSLIPRFMLSYVGSNLPVNGMIFHGGGPMHSAGTIDESKCCINPLTLDPNDPDFIAKTSGGLKYMEDGTFVPAHPERIIGNFTAVNRFLTNVSKDFIGAGLDRAIIPQKTTREKIEASINSPDRAVSLKAFGKIGLSLATSWPYKELLDKDIIRTTWQRIVAAADLHYDPGKFTTFPAYEWTSAPAEMLTIERFAQNLHRNVVFKGGKVSGIPFSAFNSQDPEDLWAWMDKERAKGIDVLAIPHNANMSNLTLNF